MKKQILSVLALTIAIVCTAADIKTLQVTTEPEMVCNNCENKIKKNLRFEKGIKEIKTDRENQVVTVIYDAEKTDPGKIVEAFGKIKYKVTILDEAATQCSDKNNSTGSKDENCCEKASNDK